MHVNTENTDNDRKCMFYLHMTKSTLIKSKKTEANNQQQNDRRNSSPTIMLKA